MNKKRFMAFMLIMTLFATVITPMAVIATEPTEGTGSNNILSDIIQDSYSNNFDSEIALPVAVYGSVKRGYIRAVLLRTKCGMQVPIQVWQQRTIKVIPSHRRLQTSLLLLR